MVQVFSASATTARDDEAQRLHRVVTELVRRYQFRDRNEICCFGISVSQCYALEALAQEEELTMGALAARMQLSVSTMTRVVDQLEEHGLAQRSTGRDDRRVCCVGPTAKGRALLKRISSELLASERAILEGIPAGHRESVILALKALSQAVETWREGKRTQGGSCCAEPTDG